MEEVLEKKTPGLLEILAKFLSGRKKVTEEEIQELMDAGEEEGIINGEENDMIRAIFTLRDTVVREIMVPRTDVAYVSADAAVSEIISTVISCGHSRIPVWEDSLDNIVGVLYAKDLLKYWGQEDSAVVLKKVMRAPFFVPETKNLEELLHDFKKKRIHIAIVIDEYGGTSGLVTIEDVLEQIVGDIQDEYDLEEEWLVEETAGTVVVDARLPIEELEQYFDIGIEREKFETVGGLVSHLTGRIPVAGEAVETDVLHFVVLDSDERRIGKLRITRKRPEESEE